MPTSIRLPPELEQRLDFLASHTGRSKAFYLRHIIETGLDEVEDYYLSSEVLMRVRQGNEATFTSAEMRKELGLDN